MLLCTSGASLDYSYPWFLWRRAEHFPLHFLSPENIDVTSFHPNYRSPKSLAALCRIFCTVLSPPLLSSRSISRIMASQTGKYLKDHLVQPFLAKAKMVQSTVQSNVKIRLCWGIHSGKTISMADCSRCEKISSFVQSESLQE